MTDMETNLLVAKIAKYRIETSIHGGYLVFDGNNYIGAISLHGTYDPLHSTNQSIKALSRIGPWDVNYSPGVCYIGIHGGVGIGFVEGVGEHADSVVAFCLAAVNAITSIEVPNG